MLNAKRILAIPFWAITLSDNGKHLRKTALRPSDATTAYRKSQPLIENSEASRFLGSGDGTDNQDYLADLQQLQVIDPDRPAQPQETAEVLEIEIPMTSGLGNNGRAMAIVHGVQ